MYIMYIIIWDLLYQVGTYVRTYVRYFWGLLIFLYQVRTYALLSGGSLYQVRTYVHYYMGSSILQSRYVCTYIIFWGLLIFLYQVATYEDNNMYIFIRGLLMFLYQVRTYLVYREILIDPR